MTVEETLAALRQAFTDELEQLWRNAPDLSALDSPRAKALAAHHRDYTEQHTAMFLNEIASLSVLYRHLLDEESGHALKAARVHAELTGAPVPPEEDLGGPGPTATPAPATPPAATMPPGLAAAGPPVSHAAAASATPPIGLTVGSLRGIPQPEGDDE